MAAAATARRAAAPAPTRRVRVSSRYAGANTKSAPRPLRHPGAQLIPIAVGTAAAVRQLPDSSLMVRLTRGRAWIALLGVLLTGIVAINVVTLSLAAALGHTEANIAALQSENGILHSRDATRSGAERVRNEAAALGLLTATTDQVGYVTAGPHDVAVAARRLAAASPGY